MFNLHNLPTKPYKMIWTFTFILTLFCCCLKICLNGSIFSLTYVRFFLRGCIYLFFSSLCVDRAHSCSVLFPAAVKEENVNCSARHFTEEEHTLSLINFPFLQPRLMRQRRCHLQAVWCCVFHTCGEAIERSQVWARKWFYHEWRRQSNARTQSPSNQIISKLREEVGEGRRVMRSTDMIGGQSLHRNPLSPLPADYLAQQFHIPR